MSRPQGRNPVLPLPLQILLLDLSSGAVLWSQALPGLPRDPQSASLPTADHRSAFFFWGLHELAGANQTVPSRVLVCGMGWSRWLAECR